MQVSFPETAELLTLPQVAALCGVSQRTIWGWAESGIAPPSLKIGKGTVRYSRRAYVDWCNRGCPPCNGVQPHDE
jgi:predicted DNA-binding transcriptional regulator AlpA